MNGLRILMIAPPVGPLGSGVAGGVETHLRSLTPILVGRGRQVMIAAPAGSAGPGGGVEILQVQGVLAADATRSERTAPVSFATDGVLENMWREAARIQDRFDAIVGLTYDWLSFYLTPFFRTPVSHFLTICSAMDQVDAELAACVRHGMEPALYTRAQAATFACLEDRPVQFSGAVDTSVFRFRADPGRRLCWAGRIAREKGLEDAAAVAQEVDLPLDVCGKLVDEDYFTRVERRYPGRIKYRGFLSPAELSETLGNSMATLVTPHWTEAFGNCVIESLACGAPVVAYNAGGPAEIVEHGKSGFLVPQGDVSGMAAAVRRIGELNRLDARSRAECYTFEAMAGRFEAWVRRTAERRRA
jgi:UDP-glucose:tetrahydrobiopterin glucosyltransferase